MHSRTQERLLAHRSSRYWLMSSVRLQPEEGSCWRMTLTLPLVGVGLQSKHVHLDQFLPAGGVITWGGLQSLKWTQLSTLRHSCSIPDRTPLAPLFPFSSADFASFIKAAAKNAILSRWHKENVFHSYKQWIADKNGSDHYLISLQRWIK